MSVQTDRLAARIDKYLAVDRQTDAEILQQLSFMVYREVSDSNLYELCKLGIPIEYIRAIVNYFDGAPLVSIPTKDELARCDIATVCYFLHHVKGKSWAEVKRILRLPEDDVSFSTVALDRMLSNLDKKFKKQLEDVARSLTDEEFLAMFQHTNEPTTSYLRRKVHGSQGKGKSSHKSSNRR